MMCRNIQLTLLCVPHSKAGSGICFVYFINGVSGGFMNPLFLFWKQLLQVRLFVS